MKLITVILSVLMLSTSGACDVSHAALWKTLNYAARDRQTASTRLLRIIVHVLTIQPSTPG